MGKTATRETASLPAEVVRPVLLRLLKPYQASVSKGNNLGIKIFAEAHQVNASYIREVISGKRAKVSIEVADKIVTNSYLNLEELYEEADKWAKENPEKGWPEKYPNP